MQTRGALHAYAAWATVILYMGVIFYLSHQPTVPIPMKFPHQDKVMHFGAYFLLAAFLAHAIYPAGHKRRFWLALVIASLYGVSDEIHQMFVPGRDASVLDWLADTGGAWMGAFLYLNFRKRPPV
jgi:VanZ family protein